jgi:DNA polymerase IV (DinB-like DNA polymerase)
MLALNPKTSNTDRHITFHVDMDSFFASVEVIERAEQKSLLIVADSEVLEVESIIYLCQHNFDFYNLHIT